MTGEATHGMKLVAGAKVTKSAAYLNGTSWDGKISESRFRAYK